MVTVAEVAPTPVADERTEFDVILSVVRPDKKITVIKEVRTITGLGLKEAKEFTEAAGPNKVLKEGIPRPDQRRSRSAWKMPERPSPFTDVRRGCTDLL
jgi:large subunit ribosomal protein L7/L12